MKPQTTLYTKIASIITVAFLFLSLANGPVYSATGINKQINFQGKVVNTDGTNVSTASYTFLFCLYTTASPATPCTSGADNDAIWRESKSITVTDGIFRTALGDTTTLPGSVDFNTDNIYLGINFNSDGQMSPLVRFTAVPYAFNAQKVAGLTVTDTTGTFTLTAGKTLSVANTLSFAGTDSTTITFQGTDTYVGRTTNDILTNKTIGSTGLIFSGATTDITTATDENLTLASAGTGDIAFSLDSDTQAILNATITSTSSQDLITSTITNQTSSGTQRGLVITNANDGANAVTEAGIVIDNLETTANTMTDYLLITKAGTGVDTTADAIDVSDDDLFNAINIGTNFLVASGDSINDFSGNGIAVSSNALTINLTSSGTTGSTSSNSGLEVGAGGIALLKGCADGELLEWTDAGGWACAVDDNSGGSTAWNAIGDATGAGAIAYAEYAQTMDWDMATDVAKTALAMTLTNDVAGSNTQYLMYLDNLNDGGSNGVTESLLVIDNSDTNEAVTDGLLFVNAGGGFTDYIDTPSSVFKVDGTGVVTALGATFNANVDMTNDLVLNIGDTGTDFTTGGGLTLAELLTVNDDVDINLAAGENVTLSSSAAATADLLSVTTNSNNVTTTAIDGIQIDFSNNGASAIDNAGLRINMTANNNHDSTLLSAINIANITGQAAAEEYALVIGTGWDRGLSVASASTFTSTLTSEGTVTIGTGVNTFTFNPASGPLYVGTARPQKKIVLSAEYSGAALFADGSNNSGNMTSDYTNAASTGSRMTYYQWTASSASLQDYDVVVRFTLPSDFAAWMDGSDQAMIFDYVSNTGTAADNQTDITVRLETLDTADATEVDLASATWATGAIDDSELSDCDSAGETCVIEFKMQAKSSNNAKIGDITLNYYGKY